MNHSRVVGERLFKGSVRVAVVDPE